MKLSKFMPTAVDYTNFLVNYIEVARPPEAKITPAATQPADLRVDTKLPEGLHPPQTLPATSDNSSKPRSDATPKVAPKDVKTSSETLASAVIQPKMAPMK